MKKKIAIEFGRKLEEKRKEKGLLQKDLSQQCGFSLNYIGIVERGEKSISLEKVFVIAAILECSVHDLIPDEKELSLENE
ncbi:helix-turn-helix transcriptional regulator [Shewanella sp. SG44-6]|jgi:transcriptional regulator with XRE-family HTH domain|uniref:helix-turn-helix domain-containing protein n=1 Tax=Shewanella sp. SG44-6 TaxID=2760959 RepID=UPI001602AA87|nr:helix-turn-helix transcriptional regulator [Shewanella sp. SG44-6]MBB1390819.1 helix-turn-helix transcriptional regulator [Shewanella sp. SG44-6]|tara:strand:- start:233 stop:472 length:240 start_codon:yes stop_codon:yes gene_type:complete